MEEKEQIVFDLSVVRDNLASVMECLDRLDSGDKREERLSTTSIVFTMSEIIDTLASTEIRIYNFLKRRQDGLRTEEDSEEGA